MTKNNTYLKSKLIKITKKEVIEVIIDEDDGLTTYWISQDDTSKAVIVDKKERKNENRVTKTH